MKETIFSRIQIDYFGPELDITHKRKAELFCIRKINISLDRYHQLQKYKREENETRGFTEMNQLIRTCDKYNHQQTIGTKCRSAQDTQSENCQATGGSENQPDRKALFKRLKLLQKEESSKFMQYQKPQIFVFSFRTKHSLAQSLWEAQPFLIYFFTD